MDGIKTVIDLSAGDGVIARQASHRLSNVEEVILGDFVESEGFDYQGTLEETLPKLGHREYQRPSLYILSETLEHLDDPGEALRTIRGYADQIVLSTPCNETIPNPEHYWAWGVSDIAGLLEESNWQPLEYSFLEFPELDVRYQIWRAKAV